MLPCRQTLPQPGPADRQVSVGPGEGTEGAMGSVSAGRDKAPVRREMSRPREMLREGEGAEQSRAGGRRAL